MPEKKHCPLAHQIAPAQGIRAGVELVHSWGECLGDRCAWWHEQSKRCAVRILATASLGRLNEQQKAWRKVVSLFGGENGKPETS